MSFSLRTVMTRSMRLFSTWSSRGRGSTSSTKVRSPVALGRCTSSTRLGCPSAGASTSIVSSSRSGFADRGLPGLALLEADDDLLTLEPAGQQLGLEPHRVVDEDDVVDQELGELQVPRGLDAPQADREERHALPRRQLGGLRERLPLGGLAVGQEHDRRRGHAAELGQDLPDAVAQPRLAARRLDRGQLPATAGDVAGTVHLGQQPGRVGDQVEPHLVLLLQLPDQAGVVPQDQPLGDVQPRGLRRAVRCRLEPFGTGRVDFGGTRPGWRAPRERPSSRAARTGRRSARWPSRRS